MNVFANNLPTPPPKKKQCEKRNLSQYPIIKDKNDLRGHPSVALKSFSCQNMLKVTFGSYSSFFFLTWEFHTINSTGPGCVFNILAPHTIVSLDKWLTVHSKRFHTHKTNSHMIARWFKWPYHNQWKETFPFLQISVFFFKSGVSLSPTFGSWWW